MVRLILALVRLGDGLIVYAVVTFLLSLLLAVRALGAPPPFTAFDAPFDAFDAAPTFKAFDAPNPVPVREQWRAPDGRLFEKHPDGVYRLVPGRIAAPGGAPPVRPFPRDAHACPTCGRLQFVVESFNRGGTHNHRCPVDGTVWTH